MSVLNTKISPFRKQSVHVLRIMWDAKSLCVDKM